jgi:small subunit ribosomal protein S13
MESADHRLQLFLATANVDPQKKVHEWNDDEATAIRNAITSEFKVEGAITF